MHSDKIDAKTKHIATKHTPHKSQTVRSSSRVKLLRQLLKRLLLGIRSLSAPDLIWPSSLASLRPHSHLRAFNRPISTDYYKDNNTAYQPSTYLNTEGPSEATSNKESISNGTCQGWSSCFPGPVHAHPWLACSNSIYLFIEPLRPIMSYRMIWGWLF